MTGKSQYNESLGLQICELLAEGKSLREICRADGMPVQSTVFKWLSENEAFSKQYAYARNAQAEALADEILEIADNGINDTYVDENGNKRTDMDVIARSRLRVDSRKWLASKMYPKKYGDKIAVGGADDMPPVKVSRVELVSMVANDNSKG